MVLAAPRPWPRRGGSERSAATRVASTISKTPRALPRQTGLSVGLDQPVKTGYLNDMTTTEKSLPRLIPTGNCWCGCGTETAIGSFFAQGHDKTAEGALLAIEYGSSVAQLLHSNGYGPGRSVVHEAVAVGVWIECPDGCGYRGSPASVKNHQKKSHR